MSLQVWLPLNGDLHNQGLDDITFTQTTVAGYEAGKIGQALQMKNSNVIFIVPSLIDAKVFSVAFWYKAIADDTITTNWNKVIRFNTKNADGTSGSDFRFESSYATTHADTYALSVHNNPSQSMGTVGHQIIGSKGSWHHACFTHTPTNNYTYLDGVQIAYGTGAAGTLTGRIIIAGASPYPNGLMNDLRIYDHCLSPKEVKELSKGLVAHYPLNDGVGGENLLSVTPTHYTPTAYYAYQFKLSENLVAGQTYTIQFWDVDVFHASKSEADLGIDVYWGGGSVRLVWWHGTSYFTNGHADYLKATFTVTEANASGNGATNKWLNIYNSVGYVAADMSMTIGKWKLEKGSVATPWIPNPNDELYSAMGFDDGVVYDCSGYGSYGENTGCTVNSDSARYKVSTSFDGTSYITLHNDSFPVIFSDDFTLSMWIYSDDDGDRSLWLGNYNISGGGQFFGFEKYANNSVRFWWNNGHPDKVFSNVQVTKAEGWILLTLVKEGNTVKIYKNGVFSNSNTDDNYSSMSLPSTATIFRLGADGRITGNTLFKGSISDVRIYATALSAEDIKELYETSASVDNHGNFYAYEIQEV